MTQKSIDFVFPVTMNQITMSQTLLLLMASLNVEGINSDLYAGLSDNAMMDLTSLEENKPFIHEFMKIKSHIENYVLNNRVVFEDLKIIPNTCRGVIFVNVSPRPTMVIREQ